MKRALVLVALVAFAFAAFGSADDEVKKGKLSGEITEITKHKIVVKTDGEKPESVKLKVGKKAAISKNGEEITFEDLKVGDMVKVNYREKEKVVVAMKIVVVVKK